MIINEVRFEDKVIELCPRDFDRNHNVNTIVVGRNGSGKSKLFQKICQIFITSLVNENFQHFRVQDLFDYYESRENSSLDETGYLGYTNDKTTYKILIEKPVYIPQNIDLSNIPNHLHALVLEDFQNQYFGNRELMISHKSDDISSEKAIVFPKIIAVSSSPFDKFPMLDERRLHGEQNTLKDHYFYRGARTKDRSSKSYMRSKFDQLGTSFINFFLKTEHRTNEILPLFAYLGFERKFTVFLKFADHFLISDVIKEEGRDPLETVRSVRFFKGKEHDDNLTDKDKERIISSAKKIHEGLLSNSQTHSFHRTDEEFTLSLEIGGSNNDKPRFLKEFSVLAEYDLVDLANIEFTKNDNNRKVLLKEASSGELCILFNILAIAGAISDDSVILLDEPELSLHPEWQKDFMPLLAEVFSKYKRCHFILATHSPHIVSSVNKTNSYIVNLEDNPANVISGKGIALQSSDYQLAFTFKSPGYKNEHLISQIVDVLNKLSEGKKLDEEFIKEINSLIEFDGLVPDNDPVKNLLSTLKKALTVLKHG
ncbi:ATP-binding protein [Pseudoalteromonas sp. NSLLW24]|uniref:AAA family ATPase n=1 Tax=Pseudoalteromonas sp. NSLLW24 TaxID=2792050 RepID=UPI0018CE7EC4|nr:AAA family ATPase [Pseudoalteromonas sp. NSLLW24]MBH0000179.1 ATP-binding protein [Pseudoalteromonas sp. NSLLW24]